VLGVDGGGSKTLALIADESGHVVAFAKGAGSEVYGGGETAIATIADVVATVLREAGLSRNDISGATFSLAGVDWPDDVIFMHGRLAALLACDVTVRNDAIGALDGAIPTGAAIVVACGTGCATASRGQDGATWHSGFWQYPLGSHELAIKAVGAICLAHQGIAPPTSLKAAALETLQLRDVEALLYAVTRRDTAQRLSLSRVTPLLLDAAEAGDPVSRHIVVSHGEGLGLVAAVAARKVGISGQAIKIALTSGVFRHASKLLPDAVLDALRRSEPLIEPVAPVGEPVMGSVLDALRRIDVQTCPQVLDQLHHSMPPPDFFLTQ
jgi:N-acetylglucosamine kinase-like BadF-type ATPase